MVSFKHCCEEMKRRVVDPNVAIRFAEKFRDYGVSLVGSGGMVGIEFCPWCSTKLPASLRDRRYDELSALGIDEPSEQGVPPEFETAEWYISRGIV
jgi:hypothetical protein